MFMCPARPGGNRPSGKLARGARLHRGTSCNLFAALLVGLILLAQPACLFKKKKAAAPQAPPPAVRIVYLPLNVTGDSANIRWFALAVPVLMAKAAEQAPDLESVPLWEAMPLAVESAGSSRTITPEVAAYIASRLTAKWAEMGELSPTKHGARITMDFIPAKTTLVPFRYEKEASIDSLAGHFSDALEQLSRYLVLRPLIKSEDEKTTMDADSLKEIAEALDREYGWFVTAEPGKSNKVVAELARSDNRLARLLFNPSLYPSVGTPPPTPKTSTPAAGSAVEKGEASPSQTTQPQPSAPPPASNSVETTGRSDLTKPEAPSNPQEPKPETLGIQQSPQTIAAATTASPGDIVPPPPNPITQTPESSTSPGVGSQASAAEGKPQPPVSASTTAEPPARKPQSTLRSDQPGRNSKPPPTNKASPAHPASEYRIQVGSSRSRAEADMIAERLTKAGYKPEVEATDLKEKGVWYRVRLPGFESREAAIAAGNKLLQSKLINQIWIVPQE